VDITQGQIEAVSGSGAPAVVRCGSGGKAGEIEEWQIYVKYSYRDTREQHTAMAYMAAYYK